MKFEKLSPGMVVFDVHSYRMGNTKLRSVGVWNIKVIEIATSERSVWASWNSNPPRRYYESEVKKWREKKPMLVRTLMGSYRLATKEEQKKHKEENGEA